MSVLIIVDVAVSNTVLACGTKADSNICTLLAHRKLT